MIPTNSLAHITALISAFLCSMSLVYAKPTKLLDGEFAKELCQGWNKTSLPKKLGRSGSEWIDSQDSKGTQVVVVNRRDCQGWKRVALTIKANAVGDSMCVQGGLFKGVKFQWKFEPTTEQWVDFSDGFGITKMPGIMKGFEGAYSTAMNNISNFEIFFAMAGYLALKYKVNWECKGADMEDVKAEIEDVDREDMREILKGMAILKD
jgi:hypothetical protein